MWRPCSGIARTAQATSPTRRSPCRRRASPPQHRRMPSRASTGLPSTSSPTLLSSGGKPLVVFSGGKGSSGFYSHGCVYGAQGGTNPWTLQNWSLSADCVNPNGPAARERLGNVARGLAGRARRALPHRHLPHRPRRAARTVRSTSTARPRPRSVRPPTSPARDTSMSHGHRRTAATTALRQRCDGEQCDVKVPNTGTNSTNHANAVRAIWRWRTGTPRPAFTSPTAPTESTCSLQLWRVGAAKAMSVPSSSNAFGEAVSAGPSGRLGSPGSTVRRTRYRSSARTRRHAVRPVQTFATPCAANGLLGLSGGSSGRVDVALSLRRSQERLPDLRLRAQVLVPLSVSLSPQSVQQHHGTRRHRDRPRRRRPGRARDGALRHAAPDDELVRTGDDPHRQGHQHRRETRQCQATDYRSGGATLHVTH